MASPQAGSPTNASPWYQAGHHWVSPFNYAASIQQSFAFPDPITIYSSTLRKIVLTSGIGPSVDAYLRVAEALEEVGIQEEIFNVRWWGDPAPEKMEFAICREVLAHHPGLRMTVVTDALVPRSGYDAVVSIPQVIDTFRNIGVSIISPQTADVKDPAAREIQIEKLAEAFEYGHSVGASFTLAVLDVGRADFEYLVRLSNEAIRLGAFRVDLLDSFASLSPEAMKLFVGSFKKRLTAPVPVTMHIHDDFGLGTAATIAAAGAGAHPDVAMNGMSYRAGHAALEEVVVSLEVLYGVRTGLKLDRLQWLAEVVAEQSGFPIPPLKPVVGSHAFLRDVPGWVISLLRNGPEGFPPVGSCIAPSMVGRRMAAIWGNQQPNAMFRAKLQQMGRKASDDQVAEIRRRSESKLEKRKGYPNWVTEEEVEAICRDVIG